MPGKMIQCGKCRKLMRSDNLKNHIKTHDKCSSFCTFPPDIRLRNSINSGSGVSLLSYHNKKRTRDNITGSGVDSSDNQQKNQKGSRPIELRCITISISISILISQPMCLTFVGK